MEVVEPKEINNILRESPANATMKKTAPLTDFEFAINEGVRLCRDGEYAEASSLADELLCGHGVLSAEQAVRVALLSAMALHGQRKYKEARASLRDVGSLVQRCGELVQGKHSNLLGACYFGLKEYDSAFDAYTAASVLYEMAGAIRMQRDVENNIALILIEMGKAADSYKHLETASKGCDDPFLMAQINDSYARAKLAEGTANHDLSMLIEAQDYAIASVAYGRSSGELAQHEASTKTLRLVCEQIETQREAERIQNALDRTNGSVSRAAVLLGIHHKTLSEKLKFKKFSHLNKNRKPERHRSLTQ